MTEQEYEIGKRLDAAWAALHELANFADGVGRHDVRTAAWRLLCELEDIEIEVEQEGSAA